MSHATGTDTVYVRHIGDTTGTVVDITVDVTATCQGCGKSVGRRVVDDEQRQAAIQEIGPWSDRHADTCTSRRADKPRAMANTTIPA